VNFFLKHNVVNILFSAVCIFYVHIYDVDLWFQFVAEPSNFCSVCGLPSMANKQGPEMSSVTQGSDIDQPQNFNETEDTAESKELSALSSVEDKGLSDSADVQSKGSSEFSSTESPLMSNAVLPADGEPDPMLENMEGKTLAGVECLQYDDCECPIADGQITVASEQSVEEIFDAAQESVVNDIENLQNDNESDMLHTGDAAKSEELSTQPAVTDTAAAKDETAAEVSLVSDGSLGELLSCADCGSSGLFL